MAYIKAKDKKELMAILNQVACARLKKVERTNNSWGDCCVYTDDYLSINGDWRERAIKMVKLLGK